MPKDPVTMARRALLVAALACAAPACMPPSWGAAALLHPTRHKTKRQPTRPFEAFTWQGADVSLVGWWFHAPAPTRGTLVYLHGVSDNRGSSVGIAEHFVPRGFDVVSYDSRAHGESGGEACTYGFYEKQDLARVLDHLPRGRRPGDALPPRAPHLRGAARAQAAPHDPGRWPPRGPVARRLARGRRVARRRPAARPLRGTRVSSPGRPTTSLSIFR